MLRRLHVLVIAAMALSAAWLAAGMLPGRAAAHGTHEGHETHTSDAAKEFAAGEPGTRHQTARIVEIELRDEGGAMAFFPDSLEVEQGEQVRFVLRNAGAVDHEFLIDTAANNAAHKDVMAANPDMPHEEPNGRRLKPGEMAELVWRFTKPGTFEIACLIPGHYESGMKGEVLVK